MHNTANVDGIISPAEEAKISIMDRGFLYGDSIYEVVRTYAGVPFFYNEHFVRLMNSAELAQFNINQSVEQLKEEIKKTVAASKVTEGEDVYIRFAITRGTGPISLDPTLDLKSSFVIMVKALPEWNPEFYTHGVKLAIPSIRRNSPKSLNPNIKGGNYLNNVLAVGEARKLEADDALMCSIDGHITEASNSNVLFVKDGKVFAPGDSSGILKGLTKRVVQSICQKNSIEFVTGEIFPEDAKNAQECFVSSATREVMPVKSIRFEDGELQQYPEGGGEITHKLQSYYKEFVEEYNKKNKSEALF